MPTTTPLQCACGQVRLLAEGAPIASVECHCDSCRLAATRLQPLARATRIQSPNGGTPFVMYRKDRVRIVEGSNLLRSFRLSGDTTTRRVVASCCHAPVCLELQQGHWLSLYAGMWAPDDPPPLEMRTMTDDLPDPSVLDDSVPNLHRHSAGFYARLLAAWIAMRFRVPKLDIEGDLYA